MSYNDEENEGKSMKKKNIIEQLFSLHLNVIVVLLQATSKDSKENNNYKIGYKLRKSRKYRYILKYVFQRKSNVVNTKLTTTEQNRRKS